MSGNIKKESSQSERNLSMERDFKLFSDLAQRSRDKVDFVRLFLIGDCPACGDDETVGGVLSSRNK